jgi:hypothetical protein
VVLSMFIVVIERSGVCNRSYSSYSSSYFCVVVVVV